MDQTIHPGIAKGVAEYHMPKPEGDIDLIEQVRAILLESGLGANLETLYDNDRFIQEAKGKPSHVQRFLLNRYWGMQLSLCSNSMDVRYHLLPDGDVNDWLNMFKTGVLPFVIHNSLPRSVATAYSAPATV